MRPLYAAAVGPSHHQHVHGALSVPAVDAADADAADEGGVVQRRDLQLQRRVGVALVRRHMLEHGLEQRAQVAAPLLALLAFDQRGPAVQARGVDHREVELVLGGAELVEQLEGGVDHVVGPRAGLVDLVDDDDGLEAQRQRLLGHEARLRHRAFLGVDQQHHAVDHRQRAFDLAAEVGVARGVDDVDVRALPGHGAVLGQDGDAALAFDVVAVHHALGDLLVLAEGAALAQQLVHQRGLAMVDVRDDGDVADLVGHGGRSGLVALHSRGLRSRSAISSPAVMWAAPRKARGCGAVDAHGRCIGQRDAAAQAGQEAAGLVVGQAHRRPVGQQHVGRQQQRQSRAASSSAASASIVMACATSSAPAPVRRSAARWAPQPSAWPMSSASVRM
jgi:hypothetical protein